MLPDFVAEPSEKDQLLSYVLLLYDALVHEDDTPGTYEKDADSVYFHSRSPFPSVKYASLLPDIVFCVARAVLLSSITL